MYRFFFKRAGYFYKLFIPSWPLALLNLLFHCSATLFKTGTFLKWILKCDRWAQKCPSLSLVYTYDASISTRNLRCDASISTLCLRLCLCLRCPGLHVRRNDASISTSTSTREWNDFHSLVLVLMLASLHRTCNRDDASISARKGN